MRRKLTVLQVFLFYIFIGSLGLVVRRILVAAGLARLNDLVPVTGLYLALLLPVVYKLDPAVFSRRSWTLRPGVGIGVGVAVLTQLVIESFGSHFPVNPYRILGAILVAPTSEESSRAVMIYPLVTRFGVPLGILITAILWASLHPFFWTALLQQIILSTILVRTRRSILSSVTAHTLVNVVAIWHISFRASIPH